MSENFAKLTENLTEIPKYSTYVENYGIFSTFSTFSTLDGINIENIPEFLTYVEYFGISVRFSVSFAKFSDIRNQGKYTGLVSTVES